MHEQRSTQGRAIQETNTAQLLKTLKFARLTKPRKFDPTAVDESFKNWKFSTILALKSVNTHDVYRKLLEGRDLDGAEKEIMQQEDLRPQNFLLTNMILNSLDEGMTSLVRHSGASTLGEVLMTIAKSRTKTTVIDMQQR